MPPDSINFILSVIIMVLFEAYRDTGFWFQMERFSRDWYATESDKSDKDINLSTDIGTSANSSSGTGVNVPSIQVTSTTFGGIFEENFDDL